MKILMTVKCRDCGIEVQTYSYQRLYCDECKRRRKIEKAREYYQSNAEIITYKQRVRRMKTQKKLKQCINAAKEKGMSYGHYMAWKEEEKRKAIQARKEKENERD